MRKKDYVALAEEIKQGIADAKRFDANVNAAELRGQFANGRILALEALARRLTFRLPVERKAFLKACGIED